MQRGMVLLALVLLALIACTPEAQTGGKSNPILDLVKEKVSDPKKPFTLVVVLTVKQDQGKALEEAAQSLIKASRKEEGCLAYDLNRDVSAANKYYFYERWKSLAALEKHMETPHFKMTVSKVGELLEGAPEAKIFAVVGE